ncbi:RDD family protein [Dyella monticola]|uniref:RDD family protein n=1 Tax=Dyella monticola TaxID=1927958 RepID=A0A370X9E1_9GAMM|nr:RDD family protein [Dyella monticola]RDS84891.1 RDD family protein [Dyella monticola]
MPIENEDKLVIAGFWRRILAFLIDVLILFIIGELIGTLFYDALVDVGAPARLIGFAVALAYFGVFNSHIGEGQTPGNRLLSICVVDAQGEPLSLGRALARSAILGTPYFLNPLSLVVPLSPALHVLAVFGLGFATIYLYVFNRNTWQSLHDLVVGSYVIRVEIECSEAHFPRPWRGHWIVIPLFTMLALGAPMAITHFNNTGLLIGLAPMTQTVKAKPHVMRVVVHRGSAFFSNGASVHYLGAAIRLDAPITDDPDYARNIARIMAEDDPDLSQEDVVSVSLPYGFDIGIASGGTTQMYRSSPGELG